MITTDVLILGAGASGLWCAHTAAKRGRSVIVVDHGKKAGNKIRIAGGGKCNFTNIELETSDFISRNKHFCKSALARFSPWHMVEYLSIHNIPWEEREHGQLFCENSAKDIVEALITDCTQYNVDILFKRNIEHVSRQTEGAQRFVVSTDSEDIACDSLVVALGGPAWPQVGATDFGYRIAKQFGHKIIEQYPALVPLAMPATWDLKGLEGIAVPVRISCNGQHFVENMLFTHTGISGPAVLQISCYWKKDLPVTIDFLPALSIADELEQAGGKLFVKTVVNRLLPERLAKALTPQHLADKQIAQLTKADFEALENRLHSYTVTPAKTEGFKRAEATGGGVNTDAISSKTMESKIEPGLFFTGEVVDVLGRLGGFNLHWAWASGNAAGQFV